MRMPEILKQLRQAEAYLEECLTKGAAARKFAVSLETVEYSEDLASKMRDFSDKMESTYKKMRPLVSEKCEELSKYQKYFDLLTDKFGWFKNSEAKLFLPIYIYMREL